MSIEVLQDELHEEITRVAGAIKRLDESKLTERVVLLLIQDAAGQRADANYKKLPIKAIRRVLDAIRALPEHCFKEKEDEDQD
jgi:hypothetical protein